MIPRPTMGAVWVNVRVQLHGRDPKEMIGDPALDITVDIDQLLHKRSAILNAARLLSDTVDWGTAGDRRRLAVTFETTTPDGHPLPFGASPIFAPTDTAARHHSAQDALSTLDARLPLRIQSAVVQAQADRQANLQGLVSLNRQIAAHQFGRQLDLPLTAQSSE